NAIGTFCHEYTHVLGAPDLYDYNDGSYRVRDNDSWPVGFWCLMSNGNYGYSPDGVEAACPTHICGFVKYYFLGWLTPTEINTHGTYTIKASELNHDAQTIYKIPILNRSDEYFFLENRDPASSARFDKRDGWNQPLDAGLLIMHVDEELPVWTSGRFNNGKPSDSWYRVWVEDLAEPSNLAISPYETKCQAAFAAEDPETEFTPTTTPYNSNANDGRSSDIYINAISHSGATMTFHYGPQSATMAVTAPNGGENWQIGNAYPITWNATNTSGNVKIEISRNNGVSWNDIIASTPDDGAYLWTAASPTSVNCLIRISDVDGNPTDVSDGPFTIATEPRPEIAIDPTAWDFGTVALGNIVEKIFVISNYGAANLDVYATTLTGTNAAEFSILSGAAPFTIIPGATSNLVLRFTPATAGNKSAAINIASNDANKNPLLVNLTAVAEGTPAISWQAPITLVGGSSGFTCYFGGALNATSGFDLGVDKICPPPGMMYYAFLSITSLPYYLEQDIRPWVAPYSTPIDWSLMIVNAMGFTTALSWDPSSLPANGSFLLTGGGLNVDLRAQNSATVTGDVNLMIQYRPHITTGFTFPNAGWYLISLPVAPANNALSALFPTALSAFSYEPGNSIYLPATNLEPKKGYWLLIPGATTANISGIAVTSFTEHYQMGWHLLGAVKGVVNFVNPNDNPDGAVIAAYGWEPNSQQYFSVYPSGTAQLNEGQGYWLAVLQPCDLTLSSTGSFQKEAPTLKATTAFIQKFGLLPPSPPFQTQSNLASTVLPDHAVLRNYPNPFNPTTEIEYSVLKAGPVQLEIYNALGQKIRTLTSTVQTPGVYHVTWDGTNETSAGMANGLYFIRLTTAAGCQLWKIMLLR
ncbi:choice-of-anchor D domain-containing protein, partial [candidate division KSB1 bacterium]|nr:choice-of-anchor D domain-containing protein [candidate division KSB1 bacterium]